MSDRPLICTVLARPDSIRELDRAEWQRLLSQAYATRLLGRLYFVFAEEGLYQHVPDSLKWHFSSAYELSLSHARDMRIEVGKVEAALRMAGIVPTFLKGVAYDLAGDRTARGRLYGDVDIYVTAENLPAAEHVLGWHGWRQEKISEYDHSYYRRWMHEIPPMVHATRGITLDVHHSLLPLTCRFAFPATRLNLETIDGHSVLGVTDRVLHAICHLFMESEFGNGVRDLSDLDLLLRQHGQGEADFWQRLLERADDLRIGRLCFYALRYSRLIFQTPVPDDTVKESQRKWGPPARQLSLLDRLFLQVLTTRPSMERSVSNKMAHFVMYLRGHWLRMPLRLLVPHLLRKSWMAFQPSPGT